MPDNISVAEFLSETNDDINSPTTSSFVNRMNACRQTVSALEETLDSDRSGLNKMRKCVKAMYGSGNIYVGNLLAFAENLEKLGSTTLTRESEADLGAAFLKFAVVTKELAALLKSLVQNINNIVMFPLDSLLKGDLKGQKGDLKKPFEKAWKDYESKYSKIEREKKQLAKEAGLIRTIVLGSEVAEEMEKERRMFQLQMCEYLIKVNEIKSKKGVELVQHLVEHYRAENTFFKDGYKTMENFDTYIDDCASQIHKIKSQQDEERKKLVDLKNDIKTALHLDKEVTPDKQGYSLHQLETNLDLGTEISGHLHKRTEGIRKVYQKRKCHVMDGYLYIAHSTSSKSPAKLNLLTCQVKPSQEEQERKYFILVTKDRTYNFMADTEEEADRWVSVLNNSKKYALEAVFDEGSSPRDVPNQGLQDLTQSIVREVKRLPGNDVCCDCSQPDPQWLSTNLGILTCIECSGIHRDMGVHISRVQSLELDRLGTAQLLLAISIGNEAFNEVFEAKLEAKLDQHTKPIPTSTMEHRKEFIRSKYEKKEYVLKTTQNAFSLLDDLRQAVVLSDIGQLLRVFAEGVDFTAGLPRMHLKKSALHMAVEEQDDVNLFILDFMIQNSALVCPQMDDGNTPLHLAAKYNKTESIKLLLRGKARTDVENKAGLTPLAIAAKHSYNVCKELLEQAASDKKLALFEHVDFAWGVGNNLGEDTVDFSDDELEEGREKPARNFQVGRRPASSRSSQNLCNSPMSNAINRRSGSRDRLSSSDSLSNHTRSRSSTDSIVVEKPHMPPPPVPPRRDFEPTSNAFIPGKVNGKSDVKPKSPPPIPRASSQVEAMKQMLAQRPDLLPRGPHSDSNPPIPLKRTPSTKENERPVLASKSQTLPRSLPNSRPPSEVNNKHPNARHTSLTSPSEIENKSRPLPAPRPPKPPAKKSKKVRALYDCTADYSDELSFTEGEIIVVTSEADSEWWVGEVEGQSHRRGVFPVCFVHVMVD